MKLMTGTSTVSDKGQLVIPRDIRRALDVKRGDRLTWNVDENGDIRLSLAKTDLMALQGAIKSGGKSVSIEDMDEVVRAGAEGEEA